MTDREAVAELAATVAHQQKAIETLVRVIYNLQRTLYRTVDRGVILEQQVADLRGRIEAIETRLQAQGGD